MTLDGSTDLPPAPPEEEGRDACCDVCGGLFHAPADHPETAQVNLDDGITIGAFGIPMRTKGVPYYDYGEADRLIGRDPHGDNAQ